MDHPDPTKNPVCFAIPPQFRRVVPPQYPPETIHSASHHASCLPLTPHIISAAAFDWLATPASLWKTMPSDETSDVLSSLNPSNRGDFSAKSTGCPICHREIFVHTPPVPFSQPAPPHTDSPPLTLPNSKPCARNAVSTHQTAPAPSTPTPGTDPAPPSQTSNYPAPAPPR